MSNHKIVCVKLPNGKVQIIKNTEGVTGEIFDSVQDVYSKYQRINEGVETDISVLESVNG